MFYILGGDDGHTPVKCAIETWERFMKRIADRRVGLTLFRGGPFGEVRISTVFVGVAIDDTAPAPLVFETLVTGGPMDGHVAKASTWEEAVTLHDSISLAVKQIGEIAMRERERADGRDPRV